MEAQRPPVMKAWYFYWFVFAVFAVALSSRVVINNREQVNRGIDGFLCFAKNSIKNIAYFGFFANNFRASLLCFSRNTLFLNSLCVDNPANPTTGPRAPVCVPTLKLWQSLLVLRHLKPRPTARRQRYTLTHVPVRQLPIVFRLPLRTSWGDKVVIRKETKEMHVSNYGTQWLCRGRLPFVPESSFVCNFDRLSNISSVPRTPLFERWILLPWRAFLTRTYRRFWRISYVMGSPLRKIL